jgi:hypothetical protein
MDIIHLSPDWRPDSYEKAVHLKGHTPNLMKRIFYFFLVIVIQVGILYPSISQAKAAQCCKTHCNHELKTKPNTCPMKQKGGHQQMDPVDCCGTHCLSIGMGDVVRFERKHITSTYDQEFFSLQPVSAGYLTALPDPAFILKKEGLFRRYTASSPPIFLKHCSFLI